jgi:hypothetical protein
MLPETAQNADVAPAETAEVLQTAVAAAEQAADSTACTARIAPMCIMFRCCGWAFTEPTAVMTEEICMEFTFAANPLQGIAYASNLTYSLQS